MNRKVLGTFWIFSLVILAQSTVLAAPPAVVVGSVSGNAGTSVNLLVNFTAGAPAVSTLQFDLILPANVTYNSITRGASAAAANKDVLANVTGGALRVLVMGLNQTNLTTGNLASIRLDISAAAANGTTAIAVTGLAGSDATGADFSVGGTAGAITISGGTSGALPTPTLKLPAFMPVNGQVTVEYPDGTAATTFVWTFTPQTSVAAPSAAGSISKAGSPFSTPNKIAALSNLGLTTGLYQVTVQASNGSTLFSPKAQGMVTLVSADLSGVSVYPNPWRSDRHASFTVTFAGLPVNTTVKIFTLSGHHVKTLTTAGNSVSWDLKNNSGDKAASGMYLYHITTTEGHKTRGKFAVIK